MVRNGRMVGRLPKIGPLVRQRDALLADRDTLASDRLALSDRYDALMASHQTAAADVARISRERDDTGALHVRVADDLRRLAADHDRLRGLLESQRVTHQARYDTLDVEHHRVVREFQRLSVLHDNPRAYLAARFLVGHGIEIGALHRPTPLPRGAEAVYVDRLPAADLRAAYPELAEVDIVEPEVLDDGETLQQFQKNSLDFVIANHFLEHCEDPIGALLTFADRVRPGGHLFLAVPDKRHTFDRDRPITTIEHLERDHCDGPAWSRPAHYDEYARLVGGEDGEHAVALRERLIAEAYSIHFHVFDAAFLQQFALHVRSTHLPRLECVSFLESDDECIIVLQT